MDFHFEGTKFERAWVRQAMEEFHADGWFSDVLYRAKGGKEANVYCCRANPAVGYDLLAAKVYRHRGHREMKNYSAYKAGRTVTNDKRLLRAIKRKSRTGKATEDAAWISHEFTTMQRLHGIGADVPVPVASGGHAMLMGYIGDEERAAPLLQEVALERDEAQGMFKRLIRNVELFLACNLVHGDLSAFNVLYWKESFKIIDFPQAVDTLCNRNAFGFFARDIQRLCQYFGRFGVDADYVDITERLWKRYLRGEIGI